jgi:uncharacterized protein (TIGR03118 family)
MSLRISLLLGVALLSTPAFAAGHRPTTPTAFQVTPLVSDRQGVAANADKDLRNPWSLALVPGGVSASDNDRDVATMYDATGARTAEVKMPNGKPTGEVAVPAGNGFIVSEGTASGESALIFASQDGTLSGWNANVDVANAIQAFPLNNSGGGNARDHGGGGHGHRAQFTGLAYDAATNHLFAADIRNDAVDVFDNTFAQVGSFSDPNLPPGYAPFSIALLNGNLYVTFAQRQGNDASAGAGTGFVDVFGTDGTLIATLVSGGALNAPQALAIAPSSFGGFAGDLLVGNHGDGLINVFDPATGAQVGTLSDSTGHALQIKGLRSLVDNGDGTLAFSAGPKGGRVKGVVGTVGPQAQ